MQGTRRQSLCPRDLATQGPKHAASTHMNNSIEANRPWGRAWNRSCMEDLQNPSLPQTVHLQSHKYFSRLLGGKKGSESAPMCQWALRVRLRRSGAELQGQGLVLTEQHCQEWWPWGDSEMCWIRWKVRGLKLSEVTMTDLSGTDLNVQIIPCLLMRRPAKPKSSGSHTETQPKHSIFKIQDFQAFSEKPLYQKRPCCLYKGTGRREKELLSTKHGYCHAWRSNSQSSWDDERTLWTGIVATATATQHSFCLQTGRAKPQSYWWETGMEENR